MKAIVVTTAAEADALEQSLRRAHAIPDEGIAAVNVGGGRHATAAQARTLRYASVVKHPTQNLWALVVRERDAAQLASAAGEVSVVPNRLSKAQYDALRAHLVALSELEGSWLEVSR